MKLAPFEFSPLKVKVSIFGIAVPIINYPLITFSSAMQMDPRLDVNEKAPSGNTPLHTAVNTGNVTIVKLLIDSGANINAWNPECDGATPLHLAIMSGE